MISTIVGFKLTISQRKIKLNCLKLTLLIINTVYGTIVN